MEGGAEVERDDQIPALHRELVNGGDMLHAGIVDEDIDAAQRAGGLGHHRLDLLGPGQVGGVVERPAAARRLEPAT